jgi:hypothetical protein
VPLSNTQIDILRLIAAHRNPEYGSTQLLHRSPDFQRFVDYGLAHASLDRRAIPLVTAVMRRVRRDVQAVLSPDNSPEISEGLDIL